MARTSIPLVVLDEVTARFVPGALVTVLHRANATSAPVYQGETGGSVSSQPLVTDSMGKVSGWLDRGAYTFQVQAPGRPPRNEYYDSAPAGDGTIDAAWYGAASVGTAAIGNQQITTPLIASHNVTEPTIAASAVGSTEIADGAVTNSKLGSLSVATSNLRDGSVTLPKLAAGLSAGNRTLLGRNIRQFNVYNIHNGHYIYPYYYPYPFSTYFQGSLYLFSSDVTLADVYPVDVNLTHQSTLARVSVWMGGATTFSNADVGLTVVLDGVPQTPMISNIIDHGPYRWHGYPFYYGMFQQTNATQQFTISPGVHSWNVQVNWASAYAYNAGFLSSGTTLVLIQEEPNLA